jgi:hypothetical protein
LALAVVAEVASRHALGCPKATRPLIVYPTKEHKMKIRLFALSTLSAMLALTSGVFADTLGRTHIVHPASKCALKPLSGVGTTPGSIVYGPFLINNTGESQSLRCPLTTDSQSYRFAFAALNVSPGWATTASCYVCDGSSDGDKWCYAPSYVSRPSASRDSVVWDVDNYGGYALTGNAGELQCTLPNGQQARDFYVDQVLITW